MKRFCWLLAMLCGAALLCGCAMAEDALNEYWITEPRPEVSLSGLVAALPADDGYAEVYGLSVDGEMRLFLPAFADPATMTLTCNGEAVTLEDAVEDEDGWIGEIRNAQGETLFEIKIMQSQNLRALFLFSDDPVNQGRAYIDGGERHSTETTGSMAIVSADGRVDHAGRLRQLRGRGNYTWIR